MAIPAKNPGPGHRFERYSRRPRITAVSAYSSVGDVGEHTFVIEFLDANMQAYVLGRTHARLREVLLPECQLSTGREHDAKPSFAAHHALVCFRGALERKLFSHCLDACEA